MFNIICLALEDSWRKIWKSYFNNKVLECLGKKDFPNSDTCMKKLLQLKTIYIRFLHVKMTEMIVAVIQNVPTTSCHYGSLYLRKRLVFALLILYKISVDIKCQFVIDLFIQLYLNFVVCWAQINNWNRKKPNCLTFVFLMLQITISYISLREKLKQISVSSINYKTKRVESFGSF